MTARWSQDDLSTIRLAKLMYGFLISYSAEKYQLSNHNLLPKLVAKKARIRLKYFNEQKWMFFNVHSLVFILIIPLQYLLSLPQRGSQIYNWPAILGTQVSNTQHASWFGWTEMDHKIFAALYLSADIQLTWYSRYWYLKYISRFMFCLILQR